jgi:hypothetical protein
MATEIYNEGPCFRIIKNGQEFLITKVQIKRIDTLKGNLVRIDIGEGALRHVYLDITDVAVPNRFEDVITFRDVLLGWMKQSGIAKEVKQDTEIDELRLIRQAIERLNGGINPQSSTIMEPLREDESQPNIVYKGYAAPNAFTYEAIWAIVRISKIEDQIIYEWADGDQNYDNVWESRYELNYTIRGPKIPAKQ